MSYLYCVCITGFYLQGTIPHNHRLYLKQNGLRPEGGSSEYGDFSGKGSMQ